MIIYDVLVGFHKVPELALALLSKEFTVGQTQISIIYNIYDLC